MVQIVFGVDSLERVRGAPKCFRDSLFERNDEDEEANDGDEEDNEC